MIIEPAHALIGQLTMPGDKSISHRAAIIAALANGRSKITNFAASADCHSTLGCLRALSVAINETADQVEIVGGGLSNLKPASQALDAGNSGSTMRMLSGILAGLPFTSEITGDQSLRRRPMKRIITPLREMGAVINALPGDLAPLQIQGGQLQAIDYRVPVASAQVKSCLLFAGLAANGTTIVREPAVTRNHTELMLQEFGAELTSNADQISIRGGAQLQARDYQVPGDLSSAAFLIAAALMLPGSALLLPGVGINQTRRAFVDLLMARGAAIELMNSRDQHRELIADIQVRGVNKLQGGGTVNGAIIANLIDEIPILAVLATQLDGGLTIRNAAELRVKESDRIRTVVDNLRAMGAEVKEFDDGLAVAGRQQLHGAVIDAAGDHRIAMAFTIAALVAQGNSEIQGSESVDISFPGFFAALNQVVQR